MSYLNPAAYDQFMGRWSARTYLFIPAFCRSARRTTRTRCRLRDRKSQPRRGFLRAHRQGHRPRSCTSVCGVRASGGASTPARSSRQALPNLSRLPTARSMRLSRCLFCRTLPSLGKPYPRWLESREPAASWRRCQWDFEDGLPMLSLLWQAAEAVAPEAVAKQRQQNPRSRSATLEALDALWRSCSLSDIRTATLESADALPVVPRLLATVSRRINANLGLCGRRQRSNRRCARSCAPR